MAKSQYINIKLNNNLIQNKKINLKQVSDQSRKNVADQCQVPGSRRARQKKINLRL